MLGTKTHGHNKVYITLWEQRHAILLLQYVCYYERHIGHQLMIASLSVAAVSSVHLVNNHAILWPCYYLHSHFLGNAWHAVDNTNALWISLLHGKYSWGWHFSVSPVLLPTFHSCASQWLSHCLGELSVFYVFYAVEQSAKHIPKYSLICEWHTRELLGLSLSLGGRWLLEQSEY